MLVTIECEHATDDAHRAWLRPNSELRFGRSSWADFPVANDQSMSPLHFAVTATDSACHIRDLNSANGLIVNRATIREAQLYDGDTIQAGQTRFQVRIEGAARQVDRTTQAYRVEPLPSGMVAFCPESKPRSVWEIVEQLWSYYNVYLVAFFDEWGAKRPAEMVSSLDTIPASEHVRWGRFLPLLIDVRQLAAPREYLESYWQDGNLLGLVSTLEQPAMLAKLRQSPATFSSMEQCRFQFEQLPPEQRIEDESMLLGCLVPDQSSCWKLLAFPDELKTWTELGFASPTIASVNV